MSSFKKCFYIFPRGQKSLLSLVMIQIYITLPLDGEEQIYFYLPKITKYIELVLAINKESRFPSSGKRICSAGLRNTQIDQILCDVLCFMVLLFFIRHIFTDEIIVETDASTHVLYIHPCSHDKNCFNRDLLK